MSGRAPRTRLALSGLLGLATAACTEHVVLDALPPEVLWVVAARAVEGGTPRVSPLIAAGTLSLSLTVAHDESLTLWGYGAELQPLMADVPQERWSTEPLREALACETTLPAPRWVTQVSAARSVAQAADVRAWTASWLGEQCPQVADLRVDVRCVPDTCGTVVQRGCDLTLDLSDCAKGTVRGRVLADGTLCFPAGVVQPLGDCEPQASNNPFASASVHCAEREGVECDVDVLAAPTVPITPGALQITDPAPASTGPDINDFGIKEIALRRMRAIPWGEQELLVTSWPWLARDACVNRRAALPVQPSEWSLIDIYARQRVASGTTAPCVLELAKTGAREAVAMVRLDGDVYALARLDAQLREVQRHTLTADQLREGEPRYMVTDDRNRPIVLYTRRIDSAAYYSYVAYDAVTLQPDWRSPPLPGTPTFLQYFDGRLWTADQGDRWIEWTPVDGVDPTDEYYIPLNVRSPIEVLGMLPPRRARNRAFMAVTSRDEPALLVIEDGTRTLRRDTPYLVPGSFPTAIGAHHDAPAVTLMASDGAGGFRAYLTTVDPERGYWRPEVRPLGLRSASELVTDAAGNAWVLAPWDGIVARLP